MADVRPFAGIRYAPALTSQLATLVTPPYDVISPEAQAAYYERHPNNIVRLELGREWADDDTLSNRYTRAAATFSEWRMQGELRQDTQPAFYLYRQRFQSGGREHWRTSLFARVRLEPWEAGVVLPHEYTMSKPKDDRLKLLRACAANLSPIMALYEDAEASLQHLLEPLASQTPQALFTDEAGEDHWLLPITDPNRLEDIQSFFSTRRLFIADGHHRYETALAYREELREMRKTLHPDDAANFVLMSLTAFEDSGLVILPTHRVVKGLPAERIAGLAGRLSQDFLIERLPADILPDQALIDLAPDAGIRAFILVMEGELLRMQARPEALRKMAASGRSAPWQMLDVAILQTLIMNEALGIDAEAIVGGTFLIYTRDALSAVQAVRERKAQLAVLVRPTRVGQLREVALSGDRMPQKSTYFYPKLITGLVINPLW